MELRERVAHEIHLSKWWTGGAHKAGLCADAILALVAEDRLHDALKAYEDTAQELHECQTERDRLREQLRLSIIDAANNEAEANELRPLAIGGDGSTHWYYRDEYERLHAEVRERERKAFVAGAYYGWDHGRTLSETLFDADGVSKERYP